MCVPHFYLSFIDSRKPPLPSPGCLNAHQILSKSHRSAAPCQSLHSKPCPCFAASLARLGSLMSADCSVGKSQDVWSMSEWSERDTAIQAKAEHQDKKKKVFPNQVSLEIRRFLTYKRRRISDDLSNRIVMSNELTASNKCLLREFMEAHCTELKELH